MRRLWLIVLAPAFALQAAADPVLAAPAPPLPAPALGRYAEVDAAPVRTSVYVGSVTLSASRFTRNGDTYAASYAAKVFPYFFLNEKGTLDVKVPDEFLRLLAAGKPIDFTGRAIRSDGRERPVDGRATPIDATTGKLKVRVIVNRHITLVFNTTYRLPAAPAVAQSQ